MRPESFAAIRLPNISARIICATMEAAGLDGRALLAKANISSDVIDDPKGMVTGAQELLLQEGFVEATHSIAGLWVRMGLQYPLMGFGPLGFAALAAGTLGAGLQAMSSFRALTFSLMAFRLDERDNQIIAIEADDGFVPTACREFCQERWLGSAVRVVNDMLPGVSSIERIETILSDAHGRHECAEVLGAPVVFDAAVTRVVLKEGMSQRSLPMANPLLEQTYRELCTQLIEEAQVSDEIVGRLYDLLIRSGHDYPNAPEASQVLGVSERTLYRRLAAQGLTFGQMLEQVRQQRASYLLDNSVLSIEQIGDALGFAETASFSRAFKRWTGLSPLKFRHRFAGHPAPGISEIETSATSTRAAAKRLSEIEATPRSFREARP